MESTRTSLSSAEAAQSERVPAVNAAALGDRPAPCPGVRPLNPRERVPVSMIIDDSTCLVNLAHFCIPHFAQVNPENYRQDWKSLPREIPDDFVREFGEWCGENGVKGKYSIVPNPACVGWLDRDLPGWAKQDLTASLSLVRDFMTQNWDIHPEMITHTWLIDTKTGRPRVGTSPRLIENWYRPASGTVDEMADYVGYALQIIHNLDLPCEGITTPGGFGDQDRAALAQGTLQACRSVFQTEIPHYFRHVFLGDESVAPRVEYASGLDGPDPRCVVSIIGCTNDWFGGWDGLTPGSPDFCITPDLSAGRMVDVISRGEPTILVCHWPGIYYNGEKMGFRIFQDVVQRLHQRYDHLLWMKLSEISRYWAARELTAFEWIEGALQMRAPFATTAFTLAIDRPGAISPIIEIGGSQTALQEVSSARDLTPGTWRRTNTGLVVCFDLGKGVSKLHLGDITG